MKTIEVEKIRLTTPPFGEWDTSMEANRSAFKAKMVAKLNAEAWEWAKNKPPWPGVNFSRGLLILLDDGSACHVTADHLNMVSERGNWYREGLEPARFDDGESLFKLVAAGTYPSVLYGCKVIAVGLRDAK